MYILIMVALVLMDRYTPNIMTDMGKQTVVCIMKCHSVSRRRIYILWFHLYEVLIILKFIGRESRMVSASG